MKAELEEVDDLGKCADKVDELHSDILLGTSEDPDKPSFVDGLCPLADSEFMSAMLHLQLAAQALHRAGLHQSRELAAMRM